jgi:hypothetical protein
MREDAPSKERQKAVECKEGTRAPNCKQKGKLICIYPRGFLRPFPQDASGIIGYRHGEYAWERLSAGQIGFAGTLLVVRRKARTPHARFRSE